jgi:hypothetical protein
MKRSVKRLAYVCALTFGLGLGLSAAANSDPPDCASLCQELLNDCIAQSAGRPTRHCFRAYRECLAGCAP